MPEIDVWSMALRSTFTDWLTGGTEPADQSALEKINQAFESLTAERRVEQAAEFLPGAHVLTSSFGAQAAVMLHLVNEVIPKIPVVLIDTGYLFPETYRFVDDLTEKLDLNLKVFRSDASPAWQESRFGKLWDQGLEGIEQYNRINKQEPLDRALRDLGAETWFAGLRRVQAATRAWNRAHRIQAGALQGASAVRLDRSGRGPVPREAQASLSSVVGEGLSLDRRLAHDALAGRSGQHGGIALLWAKARVRSARGMRAGAAAHYRSGAERRSRDEQALAHDGQHDRDQRPRELRRETDGRPRREDDAGDRSHEQTREHTKVYMT